MAKALDRYARKRDFSRTPEPGPRQGRRRAAGHYAIQMHDATRLHYDLRLEHDGVLKSWAITRGPSLDPADKRLAVETEDHPLDYRTFEGVIPDGYGAGTVLLWDTGTWEMVEGKDAAEGLAAGSLTFRLFGERLKGEWHLQRMREEKGRPPQWLLIKVRDDEARDSGKSVTETFKTSVTSGRTLKAIAEEEARVPDFIEPMLCRVRKTPPKGEDWLAEVKYDGYRAILRAADGGVKIFTRSGQDWTSRFPAVARAAERLASRGVILDGEIVVFDEAGRTDFSALQSTLAGDGADAVYVAFDALFVDGKDVRDLPIEERKERLRKVLGRKKSAIQYGDHVRGRQEALYAHAEALGLEGIIAKRSGSTYRSGRHDAWAKVRAVREAAAVVGGYVAEGDDLRSLVVGAYEDGKLLPMGRVGTGFTASAGKALLGRLKALAQKGSPFAGPVERRGVRFVRPELVADIAFLTVTGAGQFRQASYKGLSKRAPEDVMLPSDHPEATRDRPARAAAAKAASPRKAAAAADTFAGVTFSHPEKVLFSDQHVTKAAIAEHYLAHMERMLPHVEGRPLTLVRCPQGSQKACFFQRHPEGLPADMAVDVGEDDGLAIVATKPAHIMELVQRGVLEIHLRGARADRPDRPDRLVFDLDPGEGVSFDMLREAAFTVKEVLAELDLRSFVKTTGGKGLHVLVPLDRHTDWPDAKAFTRGIAIHLADEEPDRYLVTATKAKRKGRIFIDYLRNDTKASAVAPYSTRSRPGAPFAVPLSWEALEAADGLLIGHVGEVIEGPDPWADVATVRQRLSAAHLKRFARDKS